MAIRLTSCFILLACLYAPVIHGFETRTWDESYALANQTVSLMTLDEKVAMVTGVGQFSSRCVGNIKPPTRSFSVSGLNVTIPPICLSDGPAGMRLVKQVTGFPSGINTASTFSKRLMRARGVAIGEEFRGKGTYTLSESRSTIWYNNVFRIPCVSWTGHGYYEEPEDGKRMGKVYPNPNPDCTEIVLTTVSGDSFGPDPYLTGEASYETIVGVQSTGVQACAKHLVANNQEHWRYGLSADVDDRTLRELYWWPFMRSIDNAGLLGPNGILRKDGFKGYVMSDWGATHDNPEQNANGGLDMEQPGDWIVIGGGQFGNKLKNAVNNGAVPVSRLNEMVTRILVPWFRLGQDQVNILASRKRTLTLRKADGSGSLNLNVNVRTDAHTALTREIGAASAVLLKNSRTTDTGAPTGTTIRGLPLAKSKLKSIAIIGKDAKQLNQQCSGGLNQCNDGTMVIGWGSGSNSLDFVVPPNEAIKSYIDGSATITESLSNDLNDGPKAAAGKDAAIVFVNAMSGELGFYFIVEGNMGDRNDLDLWWKGGSWVAAVNSNTIVVIHSVGPVPLGWANHPNITGRWDSTGALDGFETDSTGIIYAGAPGEQTGPAAVDVLFGDVNPSGRLPFSIADTEDAYGTEIVTGLNGFPTIPYTEKLLIDYRYMDDKGITPRFEFGYGLSYTTFEYSDISVSSSSISFTVKNTGVFDGTEIPQLYLTFPDGAGEPKKVLRGFEEVKLASGASQRVEMKLSEKEISVWDTPSQSWKRPAGTYSVHVGASIKDIRLTGTF
ncbi:hypothetical protein VNI00_016829 [Paramarasmius palmivorus]|uniref:Probable beta-glucosidase G n=1 Tax=Paramarasmius palmivorus TaxID=297713 RepID=A0AAW0B9Q9_9AGAR